MQPVPVIDETEGFSLSTIPLSRLSPGTAATVVACRSMSDALHQRLQELGFTAGTPVTCLYASPLGDPRAYRLPDGVFALRSSDAARILVKCL